MTRDNRPDIVIELLQRGWSARREGKYTEAHRDVIEAISLLRQTGSHANLVNALGKLGHIKMDLDRWDEAREVYEEAIEICRDTGDALGRAHKTRHVGDVHRHVGRVIDARACYYEAVSLYRNHQGPPKCDLANAIRRVAIVEEELGQVDQAKQLWTEARELYEAVNVQPGVDECSDRLAGLSR